MREGTQVLHKQLQGQGFQCPCHKKKRWEKPQDKEAGKTETLLRVLLPCAIFSVWRRRKALPFSSLNRDFAVMRKVTVELFKIIRM